MSLVIPDETLAGLRSAPRGALIDAVCRLFDAERLTKPEALQLTGLSRAEFEQELTNRGLPWMHIEYDDTMRRELNDLRQKWAGNRA
jgi:hypothetical protein